MFHGKPIIGLAGGIGSGKSFVAAIFAELGCFVIDSDEQVREAYQNPRVKTVLRGWWGEQVFTPDGEIDRRAVARKVFADPADRQRLEQLIHPMVGESRQDLMNARANDASIKAFIWDAPLLFEAGLNSQCDAVVFVESPLNIRLERVKSRGWDQAELARREKLQMPLDRKQEISDYVVVNTADAEKVRGQVREMLSRILERKTEPI